MKRLLLIVGLLTVLLAAPAFALTWGYQLDRAQTYNNGFGMTICDNNRDNKKARIVGVSNAPFRIVTIVDQDGVGAPAGGPGDQCWGDANVGVQIDRARICQGTGADCGNFRRVPHR